MMPDLKLPAADLRFREHNGKKQVFDTIRKRYVALTPEEWVRQHFIHFLIHQKNCPPALISVEMPLTYNRMKKRCDVVVFGKSGKPLLIVECKAPEVVITQDVFHQVAMYNVTLQVPYLVVTNGLEHFACRIDHARKSYAFLKEVPAYGGMEDRG